MDPQETDCAGPADGGAGEDMLPLNKWSRAYAHPKPVPSPPTTDPEGILDFDSAKISLTLTRKTSSDLEEDKAGKGNHQPQLENNSAPAAVYDGGVRDEEEERATVVFAADGKKVEEGFIHGQLTKVKKNHSNQVTNIDFFRI
ncbi:hypothetical protein BDK51DRAFT_30283 [Blyttiomyces helicus]|uniref:Uncharacterized protein n=1 Tax=Blyttiomyces helicus TaxID=388810 RepID=A0A4P9WJT8_9FUNG|nr:hypothetical protein BDK51DRAFT_30283 [Blyttiomyces helicus]|eukprot:RKO93211.1 hypothetical protein BDK51DRAFT_30283 [Blyttiomyces helicus]